MVKLAGLVEGLTCKTLTSDVSWSCKYICIFAALACLKTHLAGQLKEAALLHWFVMGRRLTEYTAAAYLARRGQDD